MRYLTLFLAFLSGAVSAQDSAFEREFSKFDKDFERLNTWKAETPASKKLKRAPAAAEAQPAAGEQWTTPLDAGTPVQDDKASTTDKTDGQPVDADKAANAKTSALPKGAKVERLARNDRLGHQISDPEMRKKVEALYRRSDVVVQQYVLPTN